VLVATVRKARTRLSVKLATASLVRLGYDRPRDLVRRGLLKEEPETSEMG
jgi:hypothetical protein